MEPRTQSRSTVQPPRGHLDAPTASPLIAQLILTRRTCAHLTCNTRDRGDREAERHPAMCKGRATAMRAGRVQAGPGRCMGRNSKTLPASAGRLSPSRAPDKAHDTTRRVRRRASCHTQGTARRMTLSSTRLSTCQPTSARQRPCKLCELCIYINAPISKLCRCEGSPDSLDNRLRPRLANARTPSSPRPALVCPSRRGRDNFQACPLVMQHRALWVRSTIIHCLPKAPATDVMRKAITPRTTP